MTTQPRSEDHNEKRTLVYARADERINKQSAWTAAEVKAEVRRTVVDYYENCVKGVYVPRPR